MGERYVVVFRSDTDQTPIAEWLNSLALDDYTLVATQRGSKLGESERAVRLANGSNINVRDVDTGTDFIFERKS